jgi:hypothetical protein
MKDWTLQFDSPGQISSIWNALIVSHTGTHYKLAEVIPSVGDLKVAYQSKISAYRLTHIDFDIGGAAGADHAAIDRLVP